MAEIDFFQLKYIYIYFFLICMLALVIKKCDDFIQNFNLKLFDMVQCRFIKIVVTMATLEITFHKIEIFQSYMQFMSKTNFISTACVLKSLLMFLHQLELGRCISLAILLRVDIMKRALSTRE